MKDISLYGIIIMVVMFFVVVGFLLANIPTPPQLVGVTSPELTSPTSILSMFLSQTGDWMGGVINWLNPFN